MSLAKYNILVYGCGAREYAIAKSILSSPLLNKLFLANGAHFRLGENIEYTDYDDLAKKSLEKNIDLVIFGPEQPICDGAVDIFNSYGIKAIGVNKEFSKLESSKLFAKEFMNKYLIKNAKVLSKNDNTFPQVIKKDGLAQGKGVKVVYNEIEKNNVISLFKKDFFAEEFLDGEEISVMSLFDGECMLNFLPTRDFKRLNEDLTSPNTGGMGSYCPVDLTDNQKLKLNNYLEKLEKALIAEGADFTGFIYSGLIWLSDDWYVLEYNVRLGDPETQSILKHLKTDFLSILIAGLNNKLKNINIEYRNGYSACLVIASAGYPDNPKKGDLISLPDNKNIDVLFAGVKYDNDKLYSDGGRVLSLCLNDENPFPKLKSYADSLKMKSKYYRLDIDIY